MADPAYNVVVRTGVDFPPVGGNVTLYSRPSPLAAATFAVITLFSSVAPTTVVLNGSSDLHVGQAVATLDQLTLAGSGTVSGGGGSVSGTLSQTLGALTESGTGTVLVSGSSGPTLANVSLGGTAGVTASGTLSSTLGAATLSSSAGVLDNGALSSTLGTLALSATGTTANDATGLNVIYRLNFLNRKASVPFAVRTVKAQPRMTVKIPVVYGRKVLISPVTRRLTV